MALAGNFVDKQQILREMKNGFKPIDDREDDDGGSRRQGGARNRPRLARADEDVSLDEDSEDLDPDNEHGFHNTSSSSKRKPKSNLEEEDEEGEEEEDDDDEEEDEEGEEEEDDDDEEEDEEEEKGKGRVLPPDAARRAAVEQRQARARQEQAERERKKLEETISKEREKLEADRKELEAERAEQKRRAVYDPLGLLEELGYPSDEKSFEALAQSAFHRSKGATDPAHREAAARAQRERELQLKNKELEERLNKAEKSLNQKLEELQIDQGVNAYFAEVEESIGGGSPLARRLWSTGKAAARSRLTQLALEEQERTGATPDPAKLVRLFEKRRRAELIAAEEEIAALKKAGIDIRKIGSGKALTKPGVQGKKQEQGSSEGSNEGIESDVHDLSADEKKALMRQTLKTLKRRSS